MNDLALPSPGRASGTGDTCLFGLTLRYGAGGIDLGLTLARPGYRAVGHVERETYAAATLVARSGRGPGSGARLGRNCQLRQQALARRCGYRLCGLSVPAVQRGGQALGC